MKRFIKDGLFTLLNAFSGGLDGRASILM